MCNTGIMTINIGIDNTLTAGHIIEHIIHAPEGLPVGLAPAGLVVRREIAVSAEQVGGDRHGEAVSLGRASGYGANRRNHVLEESGGVKFEVFLRMPELFAGDLVERQTGEKRVT